MLKPSSRLLPESVKTDNSQGPIPFKEKMRNLKNNIKGFFFRNEPLYPYNTSNYVSMKTFYFCPKCNQYSLGNQGLGLHRRFKFCSGFGFKHFLTCRRFKGTAHLHFKCWHCKLRYFTQAQLSEETKEKIKQCQTSI